MSPSHQVLVYSKLLNGMESIDPAIRLLYPCPTRMGHKVCLGHGLCVPTIFSKENGHGKNKYGNASCQKKKVLFLLFSQSSVISFSTYACFSLKLQISLLYFQIVELSLPLASLRISVFISLSFLVACTL